MAQADIIKEFLVKLGFKTDEASLKKFSGGIENATKNVAKLVAAIEAAALTVSAGVAAFASNLEALYFAAQKTGDSATNLKAFVNAARNLGDSSEGALSSVQALARWMRTTPGSEGFLKALGVNARDAQGNLLGASQIAIALGSQLSHMPYYMANQYANLFGIGENTLRAMVNGDFQREIDKQRQRLKNSGFDQASKDAHKFMEGLRELQTYLEAFGLKVEEALMKKLGVSMETLSGWFQKNGPMIADRVADIVSKMLELANKVGPAIMWLVDKLIELDGETDGWSTKIIALIAVLNILGGSAIIGGILGLAAAFVKLGNAATGGAMAKLLRFAGGVVGRLGVGAALMLHSEDLNSGEDEIVTRMRAGSAGSGGNGKMVNWLMGFFMRNGWTKEQAAGIVASLGRESGLNPRAVGDHGAAIGLAQWHAPRQAAFAKWAGHDIRQSTTEEQAAFIQYELTAGQDAGARRAGQLLRASRSAQQAGDIVSRYYERPLAVESEAAMRGAAAVQIAQNTTINVHGGDAASTGRAVAGEQDRVNQNLTRNMQVALQ